MSIKPCIYLYAVLLSYNKKHIAIALNTFRYIMEGYRPN